jgi:hypothetical protein
MFRQKVLILLLSLFFIGCLPPRKSNFDKLKLRFVQEKIIPANLVVNQTVVGGLSSIDYVNKTFYAISDDKNNPRFYELDVNINSSDKAKIKGVTFIKINEEVDPESLRFDKTDKTFYWTSEGNVKKNISPAIFKMDTLGNILKKIPELEMFNAKNGIRHNGSFEGLSLDPNNKSIWIAMELPLKQDGEEPKLAKGKYPIRISKINKETGKLEKQFAYMLDKIPLDSNPSGKFIVNGVPEILLIDPTHFLVIERAYASGHINGGNTVKVFLINTKKATDISKIKSLKNAKYQPVKKQLLFDFESIRDSLTNGIVDNIEGVCFGPKLKNGNESLLVISDDNFRKFSNQLQQIIIFEIMVK